MERESFEDNEVAALLNDHYIAIKVDREERPDIDHIYMTVCQELTGQGGWPLTVLLTPEKKPFFAGTYFPKRQKYGRPGLMEILSQIEELWRTQPDRIKESSEKITEAVQPRFVSHSEGALGEETLTKAANQYRRSFDKTWGGLGEAPKFPTPHNYIFLLREWKRTGNEELKTIVESSLKAMHHGGIYDHIGYGFSRYSVDEKWLVPHFEKMLYDNALLAIALIETYQATGNAYFARVAKEVFHYVERVMTSPEGGFYSAEDADSEGEEGKFYVWTLEEVRQIVGDVADLFCEVYDVTDHGNFEGHNILNLIHRDLGAVAARHGLTEEALEEKLAPARQKLFEVREKRVHPHKDDKILTSWNGLMIAALAKGAAALQEPHLLALAQRAQEMIESELVNENGRLLARYRDGEANFLGYLDDYAFYAWGLQELYLASGDLVYLKQATKLIDDALDLFWDKEGKGFFFYGTDAEQLLARPKEVYDGALPSGNSVMALNLIRHGRLTGDAKYLEHAVQQLQAFSKQVDYYPSGHSMMLLALQMQLSPAQEIVIAEGENVETFAEMIRHVQQAYLPFAVTVIAGKEQGDELTSVAPVHAEKGAVDGESALYVCQNFACQQPVTSIEAVEEKLK
jgi:uncharacterized protein